MLEGEYKNEVMGRMVMRPIIKERWVRGTARFPRCLRSNFAIMARATPIKIEDKMSKFPLRLPGSKATMPVPMKAINMPIFSLFVTCSCKNTTPAVAVRMG